MALLLVILWVLVGATTEFQYFALTCHPAVSGVRFEGVYQREIAARVQELYLEDQRIRQPGAEIDGDQMIKTDRQRREEALHYLQNGQITHPADWLAAAVLFQHGDCLDHFQLAAALAQRAYEAGQTDAGWLYAAATDRYRQWRGQVQYYGTHYAPDLQGNLILCPVNPTTTDAERAKWGLPPLAALRARAADINQLLNLEPRPLAVIGPLSVVSNVLNQFVVFSRCLV